MSSFDVEGEYAWLVQGLRDVEGHDPFTQFPSINGEARIGRVPERLRLETALHQRLKAQFRALPHADPRRDVLNRKMVILDQLKRLSMIELCAELEQKIDMSHVRKGGIISERSGKFSFDKMSGK